jgi:hypothetical protein
LRRREDKSSESDRKQQDEACERDQDRLSWLRGSVSQGWAREDLKRLERDTACDRVRSEVVALLAQPPADVAKQAPAPQQPPANTPDLVLSAQGELRRLGCYACREDGNLGAATKEAAQRYLSHKGRSANEINVTDDLVVDLKGEKQRICPLTCARGEHPEGDRCVANTKSLVFRPAVQRRFIWRLTVGWLRWTCQRGQVTESNPAIGQASDSSSSYPLNSGEQSPRTTAMKRSEEQAHCRARGGGYRSR